jgi:hypothetical protein
MKESAKSDPRKGLGNCELIEFCAPAASRGQPLPVRRSLAAAFYGEAIARAALNDPDDIAGV